MIHTVETEITRWILRDDGIIEAVAINPDVPRDRQNMQHNLDSLATLTGGERRPVLWQPRDVLPLHPSAWAEIINRSAELVTAVAILVDDSDEKKLFGFPAAMHGLLFPTRVFKDEDVAIAWLRTFVD